MDMILPSLSSGFMPSLMMDRILSIALLSWPLHGGTACGRMSCKPYGACFSLSSVSSASFLNSFRLLHPLGVPVYIPCILLHRD